MKLNTCLKLILTTFLIPIIQGCDGENPSSQIDINQVADRPIVINSNFTIDPTPADSDSGDEIDVTGPWFPVRFTGSNPTERDLTIVSFTVKTTGSGGSSTWVPDLGNATVLLVAPAGTDFELEGTAFVDSLPTNNTNVYRAEMEFQGWFNTTIDDPNTPNINESTQPAEPFNKTIRFITQ